jgi:hypothetical protein
VKRKKWFVDLPNVADLESLDMKEIQRWVVIIGVVSIVGISGVVVTYQTFNPWVKWLEGWVRNHEDRLLTVQGQNADLQDRLSQLEQADLSGEVSITFLANASGVDSHIVEGFLINYGAETAANVRVELIWTLTGNNVETRTIYVGTMLGRSIVSFNERFFFEGDGQNQYEIIWT